MFNNSKYLFSAVITAVLLMLTGCGEMYQDPQNTKPVYSITIDQLASRLSLTVKQNGDPYYELTNASNRVLLFTYEGGRIYVNGNTIGSIGNVSRYNGEYYFSDLLVPKIREHLVTSYTPSYSAKPQIRYGTGTVVIDPGHGGKDPGAKSVLGYWEKSVNLEISRKVVSYLKQSGVNVVMTRNDDSYPSLESRAALANRIGADLFVSIHCNTIADSSFRGFIIFTARSASWTSKKTARNIKNTLSAAGIPDRGIQNQDFRVLVQTKCPAVLIECGFMTNYDEASQLQNSWYQDKLARAIADGIVKSL